MSMNELYHAAKKNKKAAVTWNIPEIHTGNITYDREFGRANPQTETRRGEDV